MKRLSLVSALFVLVVSDMNAQKFSIKAIPFSIHLENKALDYQVIGENHFTLSAPAQTDLFISPDGKSQTDNSPRLLFQPDSNFIITATIKPGFKAKWDAGLLLVYNDPKHYAKFCFEKDFKGQARIVTVVCNETGDDCNSMMINTAEVRYRVIGSTKGNTFSFFYSEDGNTWFPIRTFKLDKVDHVQIGFSAQSPKGDECVVDFYDINLQQRKPENWWKGN